MKPRWHQVKFALEGMQKTGWMKPLQKSEHIALFDGQVQNVVSLRLLQAHVQHKRIIVGECLTLKSHLLIEQRFEECKNQQAVTKGWAKPWTEESLARIDRAAKRLEGVDKTPKLAPMTGGETNFRIIPNGPQLLEISLVDMSNGKNPDAIPIGRTA